MRITVVYNQVTDPGSPDEADVLAQVAATTAALKRLGHDCRELPCSLDLGALEQALRQHPPDLVFNLAESLGGHARLIHAVPFLLESIGIPYTGSSAEAIFMTSHKVLAKQRLDAAGLPTPPWIGPHPPAAGTAIDRSANGHIDQKNCPAGGWMVKSLWEHASVGLDERDTVLSGSVPEAQRKMARQAASLGNACFAEQFIDGREFNLSLLAGPSAPQVLAPAEIVFEDYPQSKLRIVGYRAKWDPDSYEYAHTPRRFDFPPEDGGLIQKLQKSALDCWRLFELGGYARVDFRVDSCGRPWILEVNSNPCLSPDAGFAAALAESGISFEKAVERILRDALRAKALYRQP